MRQKPYVPGWHRMIETHSNGGCHGLLRNRYRRQSVAREAITLPNIRGATLRVTRGTLWLTEERARDDVVLRPGDNWLVESNGNTVVEAQGDATFRIVGLGGAGVLRPATARRGFIRSTLASLLAAPASHSVPYA
jgi:hypothetical protein